MDTTYARKTAALRGMASVLVIAFLGAAPPAPAQESSGLKLRDVLAKGAKRLTPEEVNQLLPGAKVMSLGGRDVVRRWENSADGKFVASGFDPNTTTPRMRNFQAQGNWHIGDNGKYCVTLDWPKRTEQWCRVIFKLDDKYYGVKQADDEDAEAMVFEFRR